MSTSFIRRFILGTIILCLFLFLIAFNISFFIPTEIAIEIENKDQAEEKPDTGFPETHFLDGLDNKREEFILSKNDFVEVNLEKMKINLWKQGSIEEELPIITKGDPQNWGGSAVGLHRILSGRKLSFSLVSDVYMPYALHYYGKYYIHGEPYYPGGEKLDSSVSGGCLRLSDTDAKYLYEWTELDMPVLVIDKEKDNYNYSQDSLSEFPEVSAAGFLVADLDSNFVFAEKNSQEKFPIASITKLMTALVVSENVDLKKSIEIQEAMLEAYGSTEVLEVGKRFRVVELFYSLLIESSNDAAEALSYFLGRAKTIRLMNEKAKSILMDNTNFACPSGFDINNISTAQDLFYLGRYILNNRPTILQICRGEEVRSFGDIRFDIDDLWNKNIFINDPTFIGGKTGFLEESGQTVLFMFQFKDLDDIERRVAIILLNSSNQKWDTQKIYIWLQENFFKTNDIVAPE